MQDLQIHNPFTNTDVADFQIQIVPERYRAQGQAGSEQDTAGGAGRGAKSPSKNSKKKKQLVKDEKEEIFPAFFCLKESIKIKKGGTANLNIIFLPLSVETHKCFIIFKDKNAGEF
jgi:hypothetical protein